MGLLEYLQKNQSAKYVDAYHQRLIDSVARNLRILGISQSSQVFREVTYCNEEVMGSVDLAALEESELYLVECKVIRAHGAVDNRKLAKVKNEMAEQLSRAYSFFWEMFKVPGKCIGVHTNLDFAKVHQFRFRRPLEHIISTSSNDGLGS